MSRMPSTSTTTTTTTSTTTTTTTASSSSTPASTTLELQNIFKKTHAKKTWKREKNTHFYKLFTKKKTTIFWPSIYFIPFSPSDRNSFLGSGSSSLATALTSSINASPVVVAPYEARSSEVQLGRMTPAAIWSTRINLEILSWTKNSKDSCCLYTVELIIQFQWFEGNDCGCWGWSWWWRCWWRAFWVSFWSDFWTFTTQDWGVFLNMSDRLSWPNSSMNWQITAQPIECPTSTTPIRRAVKWQH